MKLSLFLVSGVGGGVVVVVFLRKKMATATPPPTPETWVARNSELKDKEPEAGGWKPEAESRK